MQGAQQTLAVILSSMCTIAILLEVVAGAPLVLAANRDEVYARPTRPPESLGEGIAGGVDVLSGGTWLAIRRDGRFAAVTNQRALAPVPPGLRSRGLAVRELAAAADPDAYVAALDPTRYASMNLVWCDARGVSIAYVRQQDPSRTDRFRSAAQQGTESPCGEGPPCGGPSRADRFRRRGRRDRSSGVIAGHTCRRRVTSSSCRRR
jgi:Transport and Golgi organisation 2